MRHTFGALLLSGASGILLGAAGYAFVSLDGPAHLSDPSGACAKCHVMRDKVVEWRSHSHHATAVCVDCHLPQGTAARVCMTIGNGARHAWTFARGSDVDPIRVRPRDLETLNANCRRCHADLVHDAPGSSDCLHCHAGVAHGATR